MYNKKITVYKNKESVLRDEFEKSCKKYSQYYYQDLISMDLKHPETQKPLMFADSFPEEFIEWCEIKSLYDKKSIVFKVLDTYFWNSLPLWKVLDRLIEDRRIEQSSDIIENYNNPPEDEKDNYYFVLAKYYLIKKEYDKVKEYLDKIDTKNINNKKLNLMYIDFYYETNNHTELHKISDRFSKSIKPEPSKNIDDIFEKLFSKVKGEYRSVYLAVIFGKSLPEGKVNNRFWELAEEEFYWSPTFRKEHAYVLIKKGDTVKAFAKLLALVKEMPWDKEAALNSMSIMNALNLEGEEKIWLQNLIKDNKWTTNSMYNKDI